MSRPETVDADQAPQPSLDGPDGEEWVMSGRIPLNPHQPALIVEKDELLQAWERQMKRYLRAGWTRTTTCVMTYIADDEYSIMEFLKKSTPVAQKKTS